MEFGEDVEILGGKEISKMTENLHNFTDSTGKNGEIVDNNNTSKMMKIVEMKKLVSVFCDVVASGSVVHLADGENKNRKKSNNNDEKLQKNKKRMEKKKIFDEENVEYKPKYMIPNADLRTTLVLKCLKYLDKHLLSLSADSKVAKKMTKAYITSLLNLISDGSSSHDVSEVMENALFQTSRLVSLFQSYPKLSKKCLQVTLHVWGTSSSPQHRASAFLSIRSFAQQSSAEFQELVLKGIYLTFVRNSKFTNAATIPAMEFMINCVSDVYGFNTSASYQHAFAYLRKMAMLVRTVIVNKSKEGFASIYNWTFINSLRCWAKILSSHSSTDFAKQLVYPFVQICNGILSLNSASQFFPLHFQVIEMMINISKSHSVFIPVAPALIRIITHPDLSKLSRSPKMKNYLYFRAYLKVSKGAVTARQFQDGAVRQCLLLLSEFFSLYDNASAFPEIVMPALAAIRKIMKKNELVHSRKSVKRFTLALESTCTKISQARSSSSRVGILDIWKESKDQQRQSPISILAVALRSELNKECETLLKKDEENNIKNDNDKGEDWDDIDEDGNDDVDDGDDDDDDEKVGKNSNGKRPNQKQLKGKNPIEEDDEDDFDDDDFDDDDDDDDDDDEEEEEVKPKQQKSNNNNNNSNGNSKNKTKNNNKKQKLSSVNKHEKGDVKDLDINEW